MSAVGLLASNKDSRAGIALLSAHADFRIEDYFFLRTQSRPTSALKWESRVKPMRSWIDLIALGAAIVGPPLILVSVLLAK